MAKNKSYNKLIAGTMTAAMVAGVVAPVAASAEEKKFSDVPAGHWSEKAINEMAAKGIIAGQGDGTFGFGNNVTRAQVATFMVKAKEIKVDDNAKPSFTDVAENNMYKKFIAAAEANKIMSGIGGGNFGPDKELTRVEMAQILVNAYGFKADENNKKSFDDIKDLTWGTEAIETLASLEIVKGDGKNFNPHGVVTREQAAQFIYNAMNYKPVVKDAKVESVNAISATQVEVKFNKAVDAKTIFTVANDGTLNTGVITLKELDAAPAGDFKGKLSKDGKTLTLTTQNVLSGRYDVTVDKVKDTEGKDVAKYEGKNIDFGKDTKAPTITQVEKVNSSTVKVNFSEPLSDKGNWSFKDAKGEDVTVTSSFTKGDSAVTLTIDGNVKAGTEITATVIGAKDQANNLVNPNPTSVKFTKGDKDGSAPTVTSVTAKGLKKFEIKFSEEVQGLNVANIYVGGAALTADDTIKQDETDKTKYEVTLNAEKTAGIHKVEVKGTQASPSVKITDLSGEELKDFSQLVEFKADTVAPKHVSSEVVVDATTKEEKLVLTFDKEVAGPVSLNTFVATELDKDLVTTTNTLTAGQLTVNPKNKKQLEVALNTVKFNSKDLAKDATYTVKFAKDAIADANTPANKTAAFEVKFKRGVDGQVTSTDKPLVSTVEATNSNTVKVVFDKAVDGVTATNTANYSIAGLEIEKAVLSKDANGVANTVELTLKKGTNTLNGARNITIQNVKAKNGEVMDKVTKTVADMKENVAPTVVSAKYSNTDATGKVSEITITFSEAVVVDENAFNLFIGDTTTATTTANAVVDGSGTKELKVNVSSPSPLSTDAIAKGVTLKLASGKKVADINGNVLDFTSIKATN